MTLSPPNRAAPRRLAKAPWVRLLGASVVIVVLTASAIGLSLWWEDRPVRAIEQALDRKDFSQALDLANDHLQDHPDNFHALDQKARALAGLERWTEAGRLFGRIGAESSASRRAWSQVLLREQRWTEALPLLKQLNQMSPDDGDILHELCACEAQLGYVDESLRAAERLAKIPGQERRGRLLLGMLHYNRGNPRLAIQTWQPILDHPSDLSDLQAPAPEILRTYGRALLDDNRPAQALAPLEHALRLVPTAEVLDALAEACNDLGERDKAVAYWEQAVSRSPDDRRAREGLAQAALEKKSAPDAKHWLEPLLSRDDLHSSTASLALRAATISGDNDAAARWTARVGALREREKKLAALERVLRERPRSFWSRCARAHRFASDGNVAQALLLAEDLLKEQPDEPFVRQLADALRHRSPLPPLESIPLEQ